MKTREEYVAWAKQRALEYVDRGELQNAVASIISDYQKDERTQASAEIIGHFGTMELMLNPTPASIRRFIEGCA